jgi:Mn-dependent DtxR family transcriptional regulator
MKDTQLSEEQLLVLQQVGEWGEEEVGILASELRISRSRIWNIVAELHDKGLVLADHTSWISLSTKGRQLISYLWPTAAIA